MLTRVVAENFLSFAKLDLAFPTKGLLAIAGEVLGSEAADSNGAGKSAVLAAITWTTWGETSRARRVDDVVNRIAKKDCFGYVCWQIHDKQIEIWRYRKHREKGNAVVLSVNGQNQTADSANTQKIIDATLGFDYDTFAKAFIYDGSASLAQIKDDDAKTFFERLIGIDFSPYFQVAKQEQQAVETDTALAANEKTLIVAAQQKRQATLLDKRQAQATWKEQTTATRATIEAEIATNDKKLIEFRAARQPVHDMIQSYRQYREAAERANAQWNIILTTRQTVERRIQSLKATPVIESCPTCEQTLPVDRVAKVRQMQTEQIATAERELAGLIYDDEAVQTNKQNIALAEAELTKLTPELSNQDRWIEQVQLRNAHLHGLLQAGSVDPFAELIGTLDHEESLATTRLSELATRLIELSGLSVAYKVVTTMFSKSGLRSFALDQIIPFLNQRLAHYCHSITGGEITAQFSAVTKTGSEKFNVEIERVSGGGTYDGLSQGEQRRVDLCMVLSVIDYIAAKIETPILFFDELLDHLDQTGIEIVLRILRERAQHHAIVVITHNDAIKRMIDTAVTIVRAPDGFSHYPYAP